MGNKFPADYAKFLFHCSFAAQFLISLFCEKLWRNGNVFVTVLGEVHAVSGSSNNSCLDSCRAERLITQNKLTP